MLMLENVGSHLSKTQDPPQFDKIKINVKKAIKRLQDKINYFVKKEDKHEKIKAKLQSVIKKSFEKGYFRKAKIVDEEYMENVKIVKNLEKSRHILFKIRSDLNQLSIHIQEVSTISKVQAEMQYVEKYGAKMMKTIKDEKEFELYLEGLTQNYEAFKKNSDQVEDRKESYFDQLVKIEEEKKGHNILVVECYQKAANWSENSLLRKSLIGNREMRAKSQLI